MDLWCRCLAGLTMLLAGSVNAAEAPLRLATGTVPIGFDGYAPLAEMIQSGAVPTIVGQGNPRATEILSAFSAGLQKLRETGRYDEIVRRVD